MTQEAENPEKRQRSRAKRAKVEELEERVSYMTLWLARNGFFKGDAKRELKRKYGVKFRVAEDIIKAAKERLAQWEKAGDTDRRDLASNWWTSVITGRDATLGQKMHAMEKWQELNGLLAPSEKTQPPASIIFVEQVVTDRSQIAKPLEPGNDSSQ